MSKTNEALARRWMASKHWGGWRVGMVAASNFGTPVAFGVNRSGIPTFVSDDPEGLSPYFLRNATPDLDHPGTRAFLLEDVRRAWGDSVYWMPGPGGSHVVKCGFQWFNEGKRVGNGLTEAEALIAALEAAPGE